MTNPSGPARLYCFALQTTSATSCHASAESKRLQQLPDRDHEERVGETGSWPGKIGTFDLIDDSP
jgi:hypothetical protein